MKNTMTGRVKKARQRNRQIGWLFVAPFGILFICVFIIPIIYSVYISLYQNRLVVGEVFVGLQNYVELIKE